MNEILMQELGKLTEIRYANNMISKRGTVSSVEHKTGTQHLFVVDNNSVIIVNDEELKKFKDCEINVTDIKHMKRKPYEDNDKFFLRLLRVWMGFFPREVRDSHESIWGRGKHGY